MRNLLFSAVLVATLGYSVPACAQTTTPSTATTIVIGRTGVRLDRPHGGTFHYLQVLQTRGTWILPDIGYVDFGHNDYRELFIGGGRTLYSDKRITLTGEMYFNQSFGPAAESARSIQPFGMVRFRIAPKVTGQVVYFPYLPLNKSARLQHVLDNAKIEYKVGKSWKVGAGYGGYKYGDDAWRNMPLITTTLATRAGSFEVWLQKMPRGAQVQLFYTLVR